MPRGCGARLAVGEALRVGKTTFQLRGRTAPAPSRSPAPPAPPAPVVATVVAARPTTVGRLRARALIERAGRDIDAERERLRQRLAAAAAPEQPAATAPPGASDAERWRLRQRLAHERPAAARPRQTTATCASGARGAQARHGRPRPRRRADRAYFVSDAGPARSKWPSRGTRYDRGPAASAPRPGRLAFVRPAAFGVELNDGGFWTVGPAAGSGASSTPAGGAKKRRTSSNKRVKLSIRVMLLNYRAISTIFTHSPEERPPPAGEAAFSSCVELAGHGHDGRSCARSLLDELLREELLDGAPRRPAAI